jgi:hypothetical protein
MWGATGLPISVTFGGTVYIINLTKFFVSIGSVEVTGGQTRGFWEGKHYGLYRSGMHYGAAL